MFLQVAKNFQDQTVNGNPCINGESSKEILEFLKTTIHVDLLIENTCINGEKRMEDTRFLLGVMLLLQIRMSLKLLD